MISVSVPTNNNKKFNMNYNGSDRKELVEEYHNQVDDLYEAELLAFDSGAPSSAHLPLSRASFINKKAPGNQELT